MRPAPGEDVLLCEHPSWRGMLGFHLRGLVLAVLAGALAGIASRSGVGHVQTGWVALAVIVVFAAVLGVGALRRRAITYTVTSRRLVVERGVLGRDVQETQLERVQNVNTRQTLGQRLLGVGSIHFDTAGSADFDFNFYGVARPRELVRTVDAALRRRYAPTP